jgi:hypothetical protein
MLRQLEDARQSLQGKSEGEIMQIIENAKEEIKILEDATTQIYLKMFTRLTTKLESGDYSIERGSAEEQAVIKDFNLGYSAFIENNMNSAEFKAQLQANRENQQKGYVKTAVGYAFSTLVSFLKKTEAVSALTIKETEFETFLDEIISRTDMTLFKDATDNVEQEIQEAEGDYSDFKDATEYPGKPPLTIRLPTEAETQALDEKRDGIPRSPTGVADISLGGRKHVMKTRKKHHYVRRKSRSKR